MNIQWHATGKASYFKQTHLDDETLKLIKKSGCAVISMGMELGSQRVLDLIKKDITVADILNAVKKCNEFDIDPVCSFMIGIPTETKEEMMETLKLIKRVREIAPSAYIIGPQLYRPYPGAELYELAKKLGFKEPSSLREWGKMDIEGKFTKAENLSWVEDPQFAETIDFYVSRSLSGGSGGIKSLIINIFKLISKLRIKYNFYRYPYDKYLFNFIKKTYLHIKTN